MRREKVCSNQKSICNGQSVNYMEFLTQEEDEDLSSLKFSAVYLYTRSQREYIIQSQILEVSCLCLDCENLESMIDGIQKACYHQINLQSKCHYLMDKAACNPITGSCAEGNCENCPPVDLELIKDCDKIFFYKWLKGDKYYKKKLMEKEGGEIADELESCIQTIKMYYYRKRTQSKEYKKQIEEIKEGEAIIHVDFSENYKNKQQNKIKSACYGQGQFSLYTVCIYMKEDKNIACKSCALVTLENNHSCNVRFAFNNLLINKLKEETTISSIKFWSDKCASQFCSQYAFYMMTKFDRDIFFKNWDSLHARLNSHYKVWGYKNKKHKKIKAYRKSV